MKICVINPVVTASWEEETLQTYGAAKSAATDIYVVSLEWGTASVEGQLATALVTPDIVRRAVEAERSGADAVIVDCMGDPGVEACREVVAIPVIGPAEVAMHTAAMLGHRFSVLTVVDSLGPYVETQALRYGVHDRLASVRAFNIPVLDLESDSTKTFDDVVRVAEACVREDGAHVLIPGCTGLAGLAPRIQQELEVRGWYVPVLDPPPLALRMAEVLVAMGLRHSRRTYGSPAVKEYRWPVPFPL